MYPVRIELTKLRHDRFAVVGQNHTHMHLTHHNLL